MSFDLDASFHDLSVTDNSDNCRKNISHIFIRKKQLANPIPRTTTNHVFSRKKTLSKPHVSATIHYPTHRNPTNATKQTFLFKSRLRDELRTVMNQRRENDRLCHNMTSLNMFGNIEPGDYVEPVYEITDEDLKHCLLKYNTIQKEWKRPFDLTSTWQPVRNHLTALNIFNFVKKQVRGGYKIIYSSLSSDYHLIRVIIGVLVRYSEARKDNFSNVDLGTKFVRRELMFPVSELFVMFRNLYPSLKCSSRTFLNIFASINKDPLGKSTLFQYFKDTASSQIICDQCMNIRYMCNAFPESFTIEKLKLLILSIPFQQNSLVHLCDIEKRRTSTGHADVQEFEIKLFSFIKPFFETLPQYVTFYSLEHSESARVKLRKKFTFERAKFIKLFIDRNMGASDSYKLVNDDYPGVSVTKSGYVLHSIEMNTVLRFHFCSLIRYAHTSMLRHVPPVKGQK